MPIVPPVLMMQTRFMVSQFFEIGSGSDGYAQPSQATQLHRKPVEEAMGDTSSPPHRL